MTEHDVAERVSDEQHVDSRRLQDGRGERVVGREHGEGNALSLRASDVLDAHALGRQGGGRRRRGGGILWWRDVRHEYPPVRRRLRISAFTSYSLARWRTR